MTYKEDALTQVISALVIFRSLPTKEVITVTEPPVNEDIATAIVAVRTNRISCVVDLKHSGRAPGFALIFMVSLVPIAASGSLAVNTCLSRAGEVEVMAARRAGCSFCAPGCWQTYLRVLSHVQRSNWKSGAGDSSTTEEGASGEWTWRA
jgi:hypothetical protein